VNRILGPQGITPKFDTVEPKGGLGGENQKPKPKKTTPLTEDQQKIKTQFGS
jgi:hypothetical protein